MRTWSWFLILGVLVGRVSPECKQLNMHKACVGSILSCSCWCIGEYIATGNRRIPQPCEGFRACLPLVASEYGLSEVYDSHAADIWWWVWSSDVIWSPSSILEVSWVQQYRITMPWKLDPSPHICHQQLRNRQFDVGVGKR
ncbi:hypothetical protein ABKV19_009443 [Rosa sericea]